MRAIGRKRETTTENKEVFHATGLAWSSLFGPNAQFAFRAFRVIRDSELRKERIHVQPCPSRPRIGRPSQAYSELIHHGLRTRQFLNALRLCGNPQAPSKRCPNRGVHPYSSNRWPTLAGDKARLYQVDVRVGRCRPVRPTLLNGVGSA